MSTFELETITVALLDYVKSVVQMAWEPDKNVLILDSNIPSVNRYCWTRLSDGFSFSFENQTPVNDEVTFPISVTMLFRKEKGVPTQDQILKHISSFTHYFYYGLHPGGVGYQSQIGSIDGGDIDEKDDYAEINAQVTIRSYITRQVVDRT